ncbi:ATP-dependent DNA helicase [Paenibacillus pasadenensis]|uniref:ATP-dependent DNA helicase n=1 Tax=Paenibacillus pasadenensis TaxID=217090 RepID=UPI00203D45F7|nr:ATP-dependent DNA helicase [Paenibacillus pasadenensis]MCM3745798.1 ATP-dependent DNA helicase [Paenibacillus pasadenensis]
MTQTRFPFTYDPSLPFISQASDWIADVFYEILPEAGFEVRDEQIYMAFQLERAFQDKKTLFAEAGVGTGKTLVYLLYAAAYARYKQQPAVIACADESLIEQLTKPEGDLAKIARHLGLVVDARVAKSQSQYLCLNKLDAVRSDSGGSDYDFIYEGLPNFVHQPGTMQSFHPYGSRKDYPELSDAMWSRIGWDVFQDCLICPQRHRCGMTLSRDYYRKAPDLLICSHDFYMEHVWTAEARKREGQLPLLPEHSSVVFDEGHLLEAAAQNALTYKLEHAMFESIISRLLQNDIRETLAYSIEDAISRSEDLFRRLRLAGRSTAGSDRLEFSLTPELLRELRAFRSQLEEIEEQLVFESGLFTLDAYHLTIVEEHLDMIGMALALFDRPEGLITWLAPENDSLALVIMPRMVKEVLKERVFSRPMPILFSSATLSADGTFDYMADTLGISGFLSFSTPSPYDYAEQMNVRLLTADSIENKRQEALDALRRSGGRALLLFPDKSGLEQFRSWAMESGSLNGYRMLYEGDAEISHLISAFQNDEESVLCAATLWEGLDIPGPSLSLVIVWELPWPPSDPVYNARRAEAADAYNAVDKPFMQLRLRQGIGRLIRTREDSGDIVILSERLNEPAVRIAVTAVIPDGTLKEEN